MEIREARQIFRDYIKQNEMAAKLAEALDVTEVRLAEVSMAKGVLVATKKEMAPLEEKRDKLTQEIQNLEVTKKTRTQDINAECDTHADNIQAKIIELTKSYEETKEVIEGKNKKLRAHFANLESKVTEKQEQLNSINAILNKKRG